MQSEKEKNIIMGKLLGGGASVQDIADFISYVNALEELVEEASNEDFYGTEGYKHRLGWD